MLIFQRTAGADEVDSRYSRHKSVRLPDCFAPAPPAGGKRYFIIALSAPIFQIHAIRALLFMPVFSANAIFRPMHK
jgi:hypothetical protein